MFHLRKIEVRSMSALDKFMGVMEKIDGKIKDGSRNWNIVDRQSVSSRCHPLGLRCGVNVL